MTIGSILGATVAAAVMHKVADTAISEFTKRSADASSAGIIAAANAIFAAWDRGAGQSLVSATQGVRVEPYTLIDTRLVRAPYMRDICLAAQKLFTSYYVTAIGATNTVGGVRVSKIIDHFAPDRDLSSTTRDLIRPYVTESYQFGLPVYGEAQGVDRYLDYCHESAVPKFVTESSMESDNNRGEGANVTMVNEVSHLSIGAVVSVDLKRGPDTGKVNVMVRLKTIGMDSSVITAMMKLGGKDRSLGARLRSWRMGEISLWKDLVMVQDLIDDYRRASNKDNSGYFRKIHKRSNRNFLTSLLSGQPSVGEASSIMIVSKETIREAEMEMDGRFEDPAVRARIFDDTMMMLVYVVDEDHETFTVYTRDIDDSATYPISDLKTKGSGSDMTEMFKLLMEGRMPGRL